MTIPENVECKLRDQLWRRLDYQPITEGFSKLGVAHSDDFAEFFRRFRGPFHSPSVGHELLDIVEQDESILSNTEIARRELGLPVVCVVLSPLNGGSVLVYDANSRLVYDVDFEGGDELLKVGLFAPRWPSWNTFISDYFS